MATKEKRIAQYDPNAVAWDGQPLFNKNGDPERDDPNTRWMIGDDQAKGIRYREHRGYALKQESGFWTVTESPEGQESPVGMFTSIQRAWKAIDEICKRNNYV